MNILPLAVDELIAIVILIVSLLLQNIPFMGTVAGVAFLYVFMCIFFRKYEAVQRKLNDQKTLKNK